MDLEPGRWTGPVESGYGVHLVLVRERTEGGLPELPDVREVVRREWLAARRREANAAFLRRLREKYTVIVGRPQWAGGGPKTAEAR
jgi:parvulin-like peptidyl-prolyl isomerase